MDDSLFTVRNEFYLGNYQGAINEAQSCVCSNRQEEIEKDCIVYRSYIAMGTFGVVLQAPDNDSTEIQAVKLFASYLHSPDVRETCLLNLKQWLSDPGVGNNPTLQVVAASIFCHEQSYDEALRCVHNNTTLEMTALNVQIHVLINRLDLAKKILRTMKSINDDATLTQLTTAYLSAALSGDKLKEAADIFDDLRGRYSETPLLLNGQAVCLMGMGRFAEAEPLLQKAQQLNPTNPQTLENLSVCQTHLNKPAATINMHLSILPGNCSFVASRKAMEATFDRLAASYSS